MSDPEQDRVAKLRRFNILDTLPEDVYDGLTQLASKICGTPIALISLVDDQRQWFKSKVGIAASETPRDIAFCAHAIQSDESLFEIEDAREDTRFRNNALVTDDPNVVFYAGAPLVTSDGYKLGTMCVIDTKPNKLTEQQAQMLELLSRQVIELIELRLDKIELEAQKTLAAAAHRKLQLMTDGSMDGFWHRPDTTDDIIEWSDRFSELLGHEAESKVWTNSGFVEILHTDDQEKNALAILESIKTKESFEVECRIARKSGEYRWYRVRGTPYYNDEGKYCEMAGSISLIERTKTLEVELKRSNLELERFAYQISHDLKAPLVSTRRLAEIIIEDIDSANLDEAKANVGVIAKQMTTLECLVNGILSFVQAGSGQAATEYVHFAALMDEVKTDLSELIANSSVRLTQTITVEDAVLVEPLRVRQILQNLVSNGIKYRDTKKIDCYVHVEIGRTQDEILLSVADNGRGIPSDLQHKVFNTFTRFHSDINGSGLGLSIVKQHVDELGGSIGFSSSDNGTSFDIQIPLEQP